MKLDEKVKKKWVDALKSGKYKQGIGKLKSKNRYCCLGVAKEIGLCKKTPNEEFINIQFLDLRTQLKLSNFNDNEEWSFEKIANWINKNL